MFVFSLNFTLNQLIFQFNMPELPEVETIRNDLKKKIFDKKFARVEVKKKKMVKNDFAEFKKTIIGNRIKDVKRRGKLLVFELKKDFLLIHLKMTGQLIYCVEDKCIAGGHSMENIKDNQPGKYSQVIFTFEDNSQLYFNDLRQFGYLKIVDKNELEKVLNKYGIEPLSKEFTLENFLKLIKGRSGNIKAFLMNQELIAGIGNIYADEICFEARVKPDRKINILKKEEIKKIFQACEIILKKAIEYRGTTFNNYVDTDGHKGNFVKLLKVYGREGEKCLRCGGIIKKIKTAGRGTHFCEKCQR